MEAVGGSCRTIGSGGGEHRIDFDAGRVHEGHIHGGEEVALPVRMKGRAVIRESGNALGVCRNGNKDGGVGRGGVTQSDGNPAHGPSACIDHAHYEAKGRHEFDVG